MLKKFLSKHAVELGSIVNLLAGVVSALPINRQTRDNFEEALDGLRKASENIAKSAAKLQEVKVTPDDVQAAVKAVLPGIVEKAVAEAIAKLEKPK